VLFRVSDDHVQVRIKVTDCLVAIGQ